MTPEEFVKGLVSTADAGQGIAATRSLGAMTAVFYNALLAESIDQGDAVTLACEMIRCMVGDHKSA